MDDKAKEEKSELRSKLEEAKREVSELGGWQGFKSGEWLFALIQKSFRSYYEHANAEYFQAKYASYDVEFIAGKLIALAARNAALLGALVGAAVALPAEKILVCIGSPLATHTGGTETRGATRQGGKGSSSGGRILHTSCQSCPCRR